MPDNMNQCPTPQPIKEAVCIGAQRIYDSCSDKSCLTDLQVRFTETDQTTIDAATGVKCRSVSVVAVDMDLDEVPFNNGFYSVDLTFYFLVNMDVTSAAGTDAIQGLATATKKVILYGSEGTSKTFTSGTPVTVNVSADTLPTAAVQVASPILLGCSLVDSTEVPAQPYVEIPEAVAALFDGTFADAAGDKSVLVSIGLFSILQLQRSVQMMVPSYDFCIPDKECLFTTDDPCEIFERIQFPTDAFFPPRLENLPGTGNDSCCN